MSDSSRATKNTMAKWSCAERIPVTVIIDNYQESPFALRRDCDVWTKYLKWFFIAFVLLQHLLTLVRCLVPESYCASIHAVLKTLSNSMDLFWTKRKQVMYGIQWNRASLRQ